MTPLSEVIRMVERVDRVELGAWIERGWVSPAKGDPEPGFTEVDIARVRLICELRYDLAVDEDTVPLVLSLLDQLYDVRRQMRVLTNAIRQQPADVRRAISAHIGGEPGEH